MYNTETEKHIKDIPNIAGINIETLPQDLAQIYSRIIGYQASVSDGELSFWQEHLSEEYTNLEKIVFTLELKLLVEQDDKTAKNICYVAATCREMMAMIEHDSTLLTSYTVPSALISALMFAAANSFSDTVELLKKIQCEQLSNVSSNLVNSIKALFNNEINVLNEISTDLIYNEADDLNSYSENLLWTELTKGVKHLGRFLVGMDKIDLTYFDRVIELSSINIEKYNIRDMFSGINIVAGLLKRAAKTLIAHATLSIATPNSCDEKEWKSALHTYAKRRPFLWDNHIQAIEQGILDKGISSIVTFPTGAGKTTLSELKLLATIQYGQNVLYLVPTHALENQINRNLNKIFNGLNANVINIDGEYTSFDNDDDSKILVMTPERCLTKINIEPSFLNNIGLVIFDEFHLISGGCSEKRAIDSMLCVIELFATIPDADYMFISAMVNNGSLVARWIENATGHECKVFNNRWKPTCQLQGCILYKDEDLNILRHNIKEWRKSNPRKKPSKAIINRLWIDPMCLFSLNTVWNNNGKGYTINKILDHKILLTCNQSFKITPNANEVASKLAVKFSKLGKKVIVFALTQQWAYSIKNKINKDIGEHCLNYFLKKHGQYKSQLSEELGGFQYSLLSDCESATVHTSDLLPEERFLSERYFEDDKGVNIIVATPTLAQGINLPADVVIVAGLNRFDSEQNELKQIDAHSIMNAIGRAGRAGFSSHGVSIVIPSEVFSYNNAKKTNIFPLISSVFSRGDNCLEIEDPFQSIIEDDCGIRSEMYAPLMQRLSSNIEEARYKLRKTFYAFQSNSNIVENTDFTLRLENFLSRLPNQNVNEEDIILKTISGKTGYDMTTLLRFEKLASQWEYEDIKEMSVEEILNVLELIFKDNPDLFSTLISDAVNIKLKKYLGREENEEINKNGIEKVFEAIRLYIQGVPMNIINEKLAGTVSNFLSEARFFVTKFIPEFSYICGVFVMLIKTGLHQKVDYEEDDLNKNFSALASCIKEGTTSYAMLRFKYNSNLMRVRVHQMYK